MVGWFRKHLGDRVLWGVVQFKGPLERPRYFKVSYSDGSEEDGLTHRLVTTGRGYRLAGCGCAAAGRSEAAV
jgi:hypothetical protein